MNSPRILVESYLLEIVARARSAQDRCGALLAQDFISESPRNLARAISKICAYLSRAAVAIFSEIDWDESDLSQDLWLLRNTDGLIQQLAAHLRYVQGSRAERLPWGIIPSFEKLVRTLVPNIEIMLRPKWNYNYSLVLSDFRQAYATALEEFVDFLPEVDIEKCVLCDLKKPFHIVAFPSLERENILLHTLLGHEVGHLFAQRFLTEERQTLFKESVISQIESITQQEMQRDGISEERAGALFWPQIRKGWIAQNVELAGKYWVRAIEEILSDIVGAILFGPAALFSTLEMAMQQSYDILPSRDNNFYPPWRMRLREVLRVIDGGPDAFFPVPDDLFQSDDARARLDSVNERYIHIKAICERANDKEIVASQPIARLAYERVEKDLIEGTVFLLDVCQLGKASRRASAHRLYKNMSALINRLDNKIPPNAFERNVNDRRPVDLVKIINAAWLHRVSLTKSPLMSEDILDESLPDQRRLANRLTLKAIEFSGISTDYWRRVKVKTYTPVNNQTEARLGNPGDDLASSGGVLSAVEIVDTMERRDIRERLILTPLLNPEESIGVSSIDVRLGNQFIIMKREAFPLLDIGGSGSLELDIEKYQERLIKPYGEKFILHPRQLVIGSTLEYLQIPPDLMCYVIGKSTWGRMGLIIATATKVDPGFRGCITLEIVNEGEIPLVLYPGIPIAQLVLHRTSGSGSYVGSYGSAIGPQFPKFGGRKSAWEYWTRLGEE